MITVCICIGAPFENYRFSDADVADDIKSGKLWTMLEEFDSMGYLISASTPGEDVWTEFGKKPGKEVTTGLVAGHAYTIIKVSPTIYYSILLIIIESYLNIILNSE